MSIKVTGIGTYQTKLESLASSVDKINRGALGEGAGYVADAVKAALEKMPTHDDNEYGTSEHKLYGASGEEKEQIINNFGISAFKSSDGVTETHIGFWGWIETDYYRWPTGMIMQCIDYGNEFRKPTHTVSSTISKIKSAAVAVMQDYLDSTIKRKDI